MGMFFWGLAAGLVLECAVHFFCDRLSRKAAVSCGFDCTRCKGKKNECAGYYCYNQRRKAGITIEGEA